MEALYLAILLGCSDAMLDCHELVSWEMRARSIDACARLVLERDEALTADYPTVLAECRPLETPPAALAAAV